MRWHRHLHKLVPFTYSINFYLYCTYSIKTNCVSLKYLCMNNKCTIKQNSKRYLYCTFNLWNNYKHNTLLKPNLSLGWALFTDYRDRPYITEMIRCCPFGVTILVRQHIMLFILLLFRHSAASISHCYHILILSKPPFF